MVRPVIDQSVGTAFLIAEKLGPATASIKPVMRLRLYSR